jgi:putative permease
MSNVIGNWFRRNFSDPQVVMLAVLLVGGLVVVVYFGAMLAPVLAALVIAYLLDSFVELMTRHHTPRRLAVWLVFMLFMVVLLVILFGLAPLLSQQLTQLAGELPAMLTAGQKALLQLPERYPDFISQDQVRELMRKMVAESGTMGQNLLAYSLSSIPSLVSLVVYVVLLPLLVYFFLQDKAKLLGWFVGYMPKDRRLVSKVWREVHEQLGNYVRGKFWEVLVVAVVSYVAFALLGLSYAILLAVLVGLSVIIPYIGATVVTFPVAVVAYFQWGWSSEFIWLMVAYGVIQALDGNVLVPLLFSEAVNLHPIAIIVAVLVFGGLWGFWGVFFAIPLATLVKAVLRAWPRGPGLTPGLNAEDAEMQRRGG